MCRSIGTSVRSVVVFVIQFQFLWKWETEQAPGRHAYRVCRLFRSHTLLLLVSRLGSIELTNCVLHAVRKWLSAKSCTHTHTHPRKHCFAYFAINLSCKWVNSFICFFFFSCVHKRERKRERERLNEHNNTFNPIYYIDFVYYVYIYTPISINFSYRVCDTYI